MAARSSVVVDTTGLVIVEVKHGEADSFSRSVMPASTRAWKRAKHRGAATQCRVAELAPDFASNGRKCVSFIAFAATFDAARGALTAHIDSLTTDENNPDSAPR
jgi:hypothetical protein